MYQRVISDKAYKHDHLWTTERGSRDMGRLNHPSKHNLCKPFQVSGLRYYVERCSGEEVLLFSSRFLSHPSWNPSPALGYMWTCLEIQSCLWRVGKLARRCLEKLVLVWMMGTGGRVEQEWHICSQSCHLHKSSEGQTLRSETSEDFMFPLLCSLFLCLQ